MNSCNPTSTITPGTKVGHLIVVGIDGRHVAVRCVCSRVLTLSIDALRDGRNSCGCRRPSKKENRVIAEAYQQRQRQKIFDWRLLNGR
jgi:hypothetical protein